MNENHNTIKDKRIILIFIFITLFFLTLSFRLYFIQILKNDEFTAKALSQRSKKVPISPSRGMIFDRNLVPLTNNQKIQTLIIPKIILNNPSIYNYIKTNTNLDLDSFERELNNKESFLNIPLRGFIDISLLGKKTFLVDVIDRYSKNNLLSHVIGYTNELDNKGESGIEKAYDEFLKRDTNDSFMVEYAKDGNIVFGGSYNVSHNYNPYDPSGVRLTIDLNVQKDIESIMDEKKANGTVIVTDVSSGEILALASRPNFNPEKIEEYFENENMALYNKAIQVKYPPGSIFKIVVLLAALENNVNIIDQKFLCKGFEDVNGHKIRCNNNNIHGLQSLRDAFSNSCNSAFIQIAKEVGGEKITETAKRLDFGSKINISLTEEVAGYIPGNNELYGAGIANLGIGQGSLEVTPLQVTNLLMTIANNGINKKLSLVSGITNIEGKMIKVYRKEKDQRVISEYNASVLKEMLIEVVRSGTARTMQLDEIGGAGGKTGSSQAVYNGNETVHGWFSGFYPAERPRYVITILIENTISGSQDTLPIFEEIVKRLR